MKKPFVPSLPPVKCVKCGKVKRCPVKSDKGPVCATCYWITPAKDVPSDGLIVVKYKVSDKFVPRRTMVLKGD